MTARTFTFYCLLIVGVAAALRLTALTTIPYGLSWDEAAYAANAHSIVMTGADEWGARLPVFLKSFGEYKPALLSYVIALALPFFERPETATRFVSVMLGISSIVSTVLLVRVSTKSPQLAVITGFLLAITPWHIHYSKTATDPIIGFAFLTAGLALWLRKYWRHQLLGGMLLVLSMYSYNAERVIVPIFILLWLSLAIFKKSVTKTELVTRYAVPILGSVVLILITLYSPAGNRAKETSLWHSSGLNNRVQERKQFASTSEYPEMPSLNYKVLEFVQASGERYVAQLRPDFLFFTQAGFFPDLGFARHGNILFVLLPFCIFGIVKTYKLEKQAQKLFVLLLLVSPIPAALTIDGPHTGRSFSLVIPLLFFSAQGVLQFYQSLHSKIYLQRIAGFGITAILFFAIAFWWQDYLLFGRKDLNREYQGYSPELSKQLALARNEYDSIVINGADKGRHQLLYLTLYEHLDPLPLQSELHAENIHTQYENIRTVPTAFDTACAFLQPNTVVVLHPNDAASLALESQPTKVITSTENAKPLYELFKTNELAPTDFERLQKLCQNEERNYN